MPACLDGAVSLPLVGDFPVPLTEKQRRFLPKKTHMVRAEVDNKLLNRGSIHPSNFPWTAQVLRAQEKDGALRLFVGWSWLNSLLMLDSYDLGDMQNSFARLRGKPYFTQIELARVFIRKRKLKCKMAFRDADICLYDFY